MLSTSAAATSALLVVGNTDLNAGDSALKRRLERNYTTTVRDDGDAADPTKDVIVISGSVAAATLGGKYKTTAKGVVVLAPTVLPAMAMATAYGTLAGQTSIKIAGGSSTLAGGFATGALVPVYASARSIGWATPAATALKVALVASGTAGQVTIFRHLRGSAMVGGYLAPGRRVGYYLPAGDALTESGWQLLDNAVAHAAGLAALWPATPPPSDTELWPSPSWTVAAPAEVDMDPARLAKALSYGSSRGGSGIIVRHGRRVGYWGGQATRYDLRSSTKSFGSVMLGLALKDGLVSLDSPVQPMLPQLGLPQSTAQGKAWLPLITVRHLATQTAGFAKPGGFEPVQFEPGTQWFYSDGGPNWLADLLTVRFRQDLNQVMRSRVLSPMGIASSELVWRRNAYRPQTLAVGGADVERREFGSGISTSVDVMAKLGLMLLRDGRWRDTRILPAGYARLAGSQQAELVGIPCRDPDPKKCPGANKRYGLLFWNNADGSAAGVPRDAYQALGQFTSFILVIPSLDIVASRAGPAWPGSESENLAAPFFALVAAAVN